MKERILYIIIAAVMLAGSAAHAEHDNNMTQAHLGETAFVMPHGKFLVGLRQLSYGLFGRGAVETIPLYDLFGQWNVFGKVKLIDAGPWAIAGRAGLFYVTWEGGRNIQNKPLLHYYFGGTISTHIKKSLYGHFNLSNTSLHGNILTKDLKLIANNKLSNLETDLEYRRDERRSIFFGGGYNFLSENITVGGSHLWTWTNVHLKFGMTVKTVLRRSITILPFFDIGVHF